MRVSAVIPTYDRPDLLERAVRSVVEQSYDELELIVVDDASPHVDTREVLPETFPELESHFDRVVIERLESNSGVCAARNRGIQLAQGKYVAFLDDDDTWEPEKVERQVSVAEEDDVSLVYCWVRRTGPDGQTRATHELDSDGDVTRALLRGNITGTTSTVLVDRDAALDVGGFDSLFLRWNDWDFAVRVAQEHEFGVVPEHLVVQYNSERHQLSGDHDKLVTSAERFLEKHGPVARELGVYSNFHAWIRWGLGYSAMMNDRFSDARRQLLKAIANDPSQPKFYIYLLVASGGKFTLRPAQFVSRSVSKLFST